MLNKHPAHFDNFCRNKSESLGFGFALSLLASPPDFLA
ncbi:hypothetical protein SpAn4DRAFT_2660 [Sporomusa ovata]|uniref:Uncharacterized protein n=1 Tax=Sporomusa ovata TaxID=2378 RepID=A0A0U1L169_9FIRM|nr:hypothetical protein SpAn4DRAFT_2660 [Sporomusa ovata]